MLKSPVEGSTIALIKLEQPVTLNDFVRPICLPTENMGLSNAKMQCNTLGWARNREQLQRVQVKLNEMEKCENISISSVNNICTEAAQGMTDCNVSNTLIFKLLEFFIQFKLFIPVLRVFFTQKSKLRLFFVYIICVNLKDFLALYQRVKSKVFSIYLQY